MVVPVPKGGERVQIIPDEIVAAELRYGGVTEPVINYLVALRPLERETELERISVVMLAIESAIIHVQGNLRMWLNDDHHICQQIDSIDPSIRTEMIKLYELEIAALEALDPIVATEEDVVSISTTFHEQIEALSRC